MSYEVQILTIPNGINLNGRFAPETDESEAAIKAPAEEAVAEDIDKDIAKDTAEDTTEDTAEDTAEGNNKLAEDRLSVDLDRSYRPNCPIAIYP